MEPMTLGSPTGSPASNTSGYLPSFLLGEAQPPTTPNALSPNKAGMSRTIPFAGSPTGNTSAEFNRSILGHKTLFGYQQTPAGANANSGNFSSTPMLPNVSMSGPPTQGLFDSLRNEQNPLQTPTRTGMQQQFSTPVNNMDNQSLYGMNPNYQSQQPSQHINQFNDSLLNNTPRCMTSPIGMHNASAIGTATGVPISTMNNYTANIPHLQGVPNFWVTVYGFPSSATCIVLQHFSQFGTIVDKVFPPQNGNWVHIKYSSRLECDKALTYNEKILCSNMMIGVTQCKDKRILDKENITDNFSTPTPKIRSLTQTAYKNCQINSAVVPNENVPQKSTGLMNKAMDLLFGW